MWCSKLKRKENCPFRTDFKRNDLNTLKWNSQETQCWHCIGCIMESHQPFQLIWTFLVLALRMLSHWASQSWAKEGNLATLCCGESHNSNEYYKNADWKYVGIYEKTWIIFKTFYVFYYHGMCVGVEACMHMYIGQRITSIVDSLNQTQVLRLAWQVSDPLSNPSSLIFNFQLI